MVEVKVLAGQREIGGVCVRVEDRGEAIIFDQGVRFSVLSAYYSRRLEPRGVPELRSIGAIPPSEAFNGVKGVYVSHLHLDHVGLLGALPPKLKVYVPSLDALDLLKEWYAKSSSWLAWIPPRHAVEVEEARPYREDSNQVMALPVDHSSYPSTAYLYFGSDETVLYTGDLRLTPLLQGELHEALHGRTLTSFLEEERVKVDCLILEGTNIGQPVSPTTPTQLTKLIEELARSGSSLMVALHHYDLDQALLTLRALKDAGRVPVVASSRLADSLSLWRSKVRPLQSELEGVVVLTPEKPYPFESIEAEEVVKGPARYALLADLWGLVDFVRTWGEEQMTYGYALILTSEPHEEEAVHDLEAALRWMRLYNVQAYRLRISGHYYPHELKRLFEAAKPKRIIPVHTRSPSTLTALCHSLRG